MRIALLILTTCARSMPLIFFFFNDTATTEIYTLSLHDALPILIGLAAVVVVILIAVALGMRHVRNEERADFADAACRARRSEEHTSELQSRSDLVCRLLLEKKR